MKLEHVAIYTHQLETLKGFYEKYFNACVLDPDGNRVEITVANL